MQTIFSKDDMKPILRASRMFETSDKKLWEQLVELSDHDQWIYQMQGAEGGPLTSKLQVEINQEHQLLEGTVYFLNDMAKVPPEVPMQHWRLDIRPHGSKMELALTIQFKTREIMDQALMLGLEDDISHAHDRIDTRLKSGLAAFI